MSDQQPSPLSQTELEERFRRQTVAKRILRKLPNEIKTMVVRGLHFIQFADSVSPNDPKYQVQFEDACRSNGLLREKGASWGEEFQKFLSSLPQIPLTGLLERSMKNDRRVAGKPIFLDRLSEHRGTFCAVEIETTVKMSENEETLEDLEIRNVSLTKLGGDLRIELGNPYDMADAKDDGSFRKEICSIGKTMRINEGMESPFPSSPIRQLAFDSQCVYYEKGGRFCAKSLDSRNKHPGHVANSLWPKKHAFVVSNNKLFEVTTHKYVVCYDLDAGHATGTYDKDICQSPSLYAYENSLVVFDPEHSISIYHSQPRRLQRTAIFRCQNRQLSRSAFLLLLDQKDGCALLKTFTITHSKPIQQTVQKCSSNAIFGRYSDNVFFVIDGGKRNIFYMVSAEEPPLLIFAGPDLS
ncbi:unnamed protein product [Bursaphelenchus xylophilus]|uniref:(pine wood nematode) hypothetical protein n=1 Tax=Bursaphelenchus xylophilus TaxID=6326 RepID=A0A1I7SBQ8_BURXY|nr:unnamed protein product [Bursaphelenchus xylophilus]CAG9111200.1 unnamed protein product [Bursaphelenchus xylophilus]